MASRNTRLLYRQLEQAETNFARALDDRSRPVAGRSWSWWDGYVNALKDAIRLMKGEPAWSTPDDAA